MDQEQPKIDPDGSTGSQICHLDRIHIKFPDVEVGDCPFGNCLFAVLLL